MEMKEHKFTSMKKENDKKQKHTGDTRSCVQIGTKTLFNRLRKKLKKCSTIQEIG